jgi:acyl carrier protein
MNGALLSLVLAVIGGVLLAIQAPTNAILGKASGSAIVAAFISAGPPGGLALRTPSPYAISARSCSPKPRPSATARRQAGAAKRRNRAPLRCLSGRAALTSPLMSDRQQIYARTVELIEPYNKKGVAITEATRFAQDLEWDSLTVLDFVANIEDEFDVIITMNMQAEIETVGQLVDALVRLTDSRA